MSIWWKRIGYIISVLVFCGTILGFVRAHELKLNKVETKQESIEEDIGEIKQTVGKILDILLEK